jgi:hypothetical protein
MPIHHKPLPDLSHQSLWISQLTCKSFFSIYLASALFCLFVLHSYTNIIIINAQQKQQQSSAIYIFVCQVWCWMACESFYAFEIFSQSRLLLSVILGALSNAFYLAHWFRYTIASVSEKSLFVACKMRHLTKWNAIKCDWGLPSLKYDMIHNNANLYLTPLNCEWLHIENNGHKMIIWISLFLLTSSYSIGHTKILSPLIVSRFPHFFHMVLVSRSHLECQFPIY